MESEPFDDVDADGPVAVPGKRGLWLGAMAGGMFLAVSTWVLMDFAVDRLEVYAHEAASLERFRQIFLHMAAAQTSFVILAMSLPALAYQHRDRALHRAAAQAAARKTMLTAQERAARLAATDGLTGLLNRTGLASEYDLRRNHLRDRDMVLTLVLIDIDDFKAINYGQGHVYGDRVLARLAALLTEVVRKGDTVGRLAGDEFMLILASRRFENAGDLIVSRLIERVAADPEFRNSNPPVALSAGVAMVWKSETSFSDAMKQADLALSQAKQDGRWRVVNYQPKMIERFDRRNQILGAVRMALKADEIVPAYQPVLRLADRSIAGLEVLARWRKPDGDLLAAGRFAEAFSDPELSTQISMRMLEAAARDCRRLVEQHLEFGRIALNVTEGQVADPHFAEALLDTLLLEGVSPRSMTIELTENILLSKREATIRQTLEHLSEAGVWIALNDFGIGFASLLRRFPVDQIKLDLTVIGNITSEPDAQTITAATIGMAHELDIEVIAEGVTSAETEAMLRKMDCDFAQGYLYARPETFENLTVLLKRGLAA